MIHLKYLIYSSNMHTSIANKLPYLNSILLPVTPGRKQSAELLLGLSLQRGSLRHLFQWIDTDLALRRRPDFAVQGGQAAHGEIHSARKYVLSCNFLFAA